MTPARQLPLDLGHRPSLSGENFLVADSNAAAVAWLDRWPDWPGSTLVIAGPPGCGKTHLAHVFQARCGGAPLLAPPALAGSDARTLLGAARACVLDGMGEEELAAGAEETLFHLYNALVERRGHLLVTARRPPAQWAVRLPDLRSRLNAAAVAEIAPPDDALMAAVLVKLFADRQLPIGEEAVSYLLSRMERSFDSARRIAAAADAAALAARRPITVPLLREVLETMAGGDG